MYIFIAALGLQGILEFVTVVFIFIVILLLTHYVTKWIGSIQKKQAIGKNISSLEVFRLSNNKYVQILKIGNEYVAIAVAKDSVTYLGKIDEENLDFTKETVNEGQSFGSVMDALKKLKERDFK